MVSNVRLKIIFGHPIPNIATRNIWVRRGAFDPPTVYKKSSLLQDLSRMHLESMRLHCLYAITKILLYSRVVDLYI